MAPTRSYPGVYVQEIQTGNRSIPGVATSIAAFIGRAARGRTDFPVRISSFGEYQRLFGPRWTSDTLSPELTMPNAVEHFFRHGGSDAIIVRVAASATPARLALPAGNHTLRLLAASPGAWGNRLRVSVNQATRGARDADQFDLVIEELAEVGSTQVVTSEVFPNVSSLATHPRYITTVLLGDSQLLRVDAETPVPPHRPDSISNLAASGGDDGHAISDAQISAVDLQANRLGIWALDHADLFNLLYIPPFTHDTDVSDTTLVTATSYCQARRALHIIDAKLAWRDIASAQSGVNSLRNVIGNAAAINAAVYFPRLCMANPLAKNATASYGPGGAIAGIIARSDRSRGVWKAPAGLSASFVGVAKLAFTATDAENASINPLGMNLLRSFPAHGTIIWGARTLAGADKFASEWKYLSVRRTALFIEESLLRGTQWAMFEANDERLWQQIRSAVDGFMHDLFRQGAFQGSSGKEAYFVKCSAETTTQADRDRGIVTIDLGFAPLKPAEFVVLRIRQQAGDSSVRRSGR